MDKIPEGITLCTLDCILMPQGEVIFLGRTIGWFKESKEYLNVKEEKKAKGE